MDITGRILVRDLSSLNRSTKVAVYQDGSRNRPKDISVDEIQICNSTLSSEVEFLNIIGLVRSCSDIRLKKVLSAKENLKNHFTSDNKIREDVLVKLVDKIQDFI